MSNISDQLGNMGEVLQALNDAGASIHRESIDVENTNPDATTATVTFTINHGEDE